MADKRIPFGSTRIKARSDIVSACLAAGCRVFNFHRASGKPVEWSEGEGGLRWRDDAGFESSPVAAEGMSECVFFAAGRVPSGAAGDVDATDTEIIAYFERQADDEDLRERDALWRKAAEILRTRRLP